MNSEKVYAMSFSKIYPLLAAKVQKKGRTLEELDGLIGWLTGSRAEEIRDAVSRSVTYGDFFRNAPEPNPDREKITGVVCGVRVEDVEEPLMREIRYLDKLVDDLAKGKPVEKILPGKTKDMWECPKCGRTFRHRNQDHYCGEAPATIGEYIGRQPEEVQALLRMVNGTVRKALPDAVEKISWSMPTYWNKRNLIQFAAFKKHIGLYPGPEAVEAFADRLQGYKTSKGAIQLPYDKPLPLELIADIAEWCGKENA